jgi:3-methyladenine DNA glycosylase/8-oxoguanine DNA glycosylase
VSFTSLIGRFGIIKADTSSDSKKRRYSEGAIGSVNWDAVRQASIDDLAESIKGGGLQAMKARSIKSILDSVWSEGKERRRKARQEEALAKIAKRHTEGCEDDSDLSDIEDDDEDDGELSLEHLRQLDDQAVMKALTSYNGIGPKAAACVMLFGKSPSAQNKWSRVIDCAC